MRREAHFFIPPMEGWRHALQNESRFTLTPASGNVSEILNVLKDNTCVTFLDMSLEEFTVEMVEAFCRVLSCNKTLRTIHLKFFVISKESNRLLCTAFEKNVTVQSFVFNGVGRYDGRFMGNIFASNNSLTSLTLSGCVNNGEIQNLFSALERNTSLCKLVLAYIPFQSKDCESVHRCLAVNSTLISLRITYANLGRDGMGYISNALIANRTLTVLDLSNNNLGWSKIPKLCTSLEKNSSLTYLCLQANSINDKCASAFEKLLSINTTLTSLDLAYNAIDALNFAVIGRTLKNCNGSMINMNISCPCPEIREALERNRSAHAKTREAVICLLLIGRFRRRFYGIPYDVWKMIGRKLWATRVESVWW